MKCPSWNLKNYRIQKPSRNPSQLATSLLKPHDSSCQLTSIPSIPSLPHQSSRGLAGRTVPCYDCSKPSPNIDMKTKKCRNSIPWTLCLANEHAWALTGDRRVLIPGGKIEQICENKWIRQPDISWHDRSQYRDVYYIHIIMCVCKEVCNTYIYILIMCACAWVCSKYI